MGNSGAVFMERKELGGNGACRGKLRSAEEYEARRMIDNPRTIAARIRLLLTDVDGVLTDGGVYYGAEGEALKRFNIRDGMAVERLRAVGVDVGIITGEQSASVIKRAEKLRIEMTRLFCKDKPAALGEILRDHDYDAAEIAYIGDDVNDVEVMKLVALPAAPADALPEAMAVARYVCKRPGGHGAFREFAEFIIAAKTGKEFRM